MNKQPLESYEAPTAQLIELRFESSILTVSGEDTTINPGLFDDWGLF